MRKVLATLFSAATVAGLLVFAPAQAAAPVVIEKSLLGIRILGTYHDVFRKFGQPTLVVRGGEKVLVELAKDAQGNENGGIKAVSYIGGNGGGPGGPGGPSSTGGGGGPSMGPRPSMKGGGGPMSGGMGGPGASMGGAGGGLGSSQDESDVTFGESGAYAWVYKDPHAETAYAFAFNLQGRVLLVVEWGNRGGMPTQRGLKLGDSLKSLYEIYGWPDTIQEQPPAMVLDYGNKYHAKFAIIKDKIVGVAVSLAENMPFHFYPEDNNGGPGGGGKGGPGGPAPGGSMGGGRRGGGGASAD